MIKNLICKLFGHKIQFLPIKTATEVRADHEVRTTTYALVCSRCGFQIGWRVGT